MNIEVLCPFQNQNLIFFEAASKPRYFDMLGIRIPGYCQ